MKTNKKYFNFDDLINKIEHVDENDTSRGYTYDGVNDQKTTWKDESKNYWVIKSPSKTNEKTQEKIDQQQSKYNNSVFSEYVASNIVNNLNYENIYAHDTKLVYFNNKICVSCFHFILNKKSNDNISFENFLIRSKLYSNDEVIFSKIDEKIYKHRYLDLNTFHKWLDYQTLIDKKEFEEWFYDMFLIDCLLLNWDRNPTNWGFIIQTNKDDAFDQTFDFAPLYDFGSSLFAKYDDNALYEFIDDEKNANLNNLVINKIFNTNSYFSDSSNYFDKQRLNYQEYLQITKREQVIDAMHRFMNNVNVSQLLNTIDNLTLLEDQKEIYKLLISESYYQTKESILLNENYLKKYVNQQKKGLER